ncbi:hypothetical protein [Deinococcus sp. Leaf326]|uniref:hypothetical protein n=1 Tax=Deinococcus sp. Leaf326 TaxID=1736338 RepID=UPI001F30E51C|nr:hypothetical protein [Deinococcus sp. Leaf326]
MIQSHHIFQDGWAKACLQTEKYSSRSAPTVMIETNNSGGFNGKDLGFTTQPSLPHTMITALQNKRTILPCSELRRVVEYSATDLLAVNFKEDDVKCAMIFVYDMLTKLGKSKGTDFDTIAVGGDVMYESNQNYGCYAKQVKLR